MYRGSATQPRKRTRVGQSRDSQIVARKRYGGRSVGARGSFMGAYMGANERFGSGDEEPNQHRREQVISYSPALESAYREIAELKDKLAQEKLNLEDEISGWLTIEGFWGK